MLAVLLQLPFKLNSHLKMPKSDPQAVAPYRELKKLVVLGLPGTEIPSGFAEGRFQYWRM